MLKRIKTIDSIELIGAIWSPTGIGLHIMEVGMKLRKNPKDESDLSNYAKRSLISISLFGGKAYFRILYFLSFSIG
jgi:hypothetical protein